MHCAHSLVRMVTGLMASDGSRKSTLSPLRMYERR